MSPRALANVLIRIANAESDDPQAWLIALLTSKYGEASSSNGQIVGTSVNGKSVSIQMIPGVSVADYMSAANLALAALERGLSGVPASTQALMR